MTCESITCNMCMAFIRDEVGNGMISLPICMLHVPDFSGPTLFMVLSREDAVDGWRSLIGSTDPKQAKEQDPDS